MAIDPIVPAIVIGTALLFGSGALKKKTKKAATDAIDDANGGGDGSSKKPKRPGKKPSDDDAWEMCPDGWYRDAQGDVICENLVIDDDDLIVAPESLYLSDDCQEVIEGDEFFDLLRETAIEWLEYDFKNYGNLTYLMREVLLTPDEESEDPYGFPECVAEWPSFQAIYLDVPGGPWDTDTTAGFNNWTAANDAYEAEYPALDAWLWELQARMLEDPVLRIYLLGWIEQYAGTGWSFNPPCGGDTGVPCS